MIVFVSWLGSKVVGLLRLVVRGHWHLFFSQSMKFWVSSSSISSRKKLSIGQLHWPFNCLDIMPSPNQMKLRNGNSQFIRKLLKHKCFILKHSHKQVLSLCAQKTPSIWQELIKWWKNSNCISLTFSFSLFAETGLQWSLKENLCRTRREKVMYRYFGEIKIHRWCTQTKKMLLDLAAKLLCTWDHYHG